MDKVQFAVKYLFQPEKITIKKAGKIKTIYINDQDQAYDHNSNNKKIKIQIKKPPFVILISAF